MNNFKGEMINEKKHGQGRMIYANGDSYTGMWVDDNRTGQGIYVYTDGSRYEWRCSCINRHISAILRFPDAAIL